MLVIPAIDLKNGKCVRLSQGRPEAETVYGDDPVAVARRFASEGAQMLHLVDLDGAFQGQTANLEAIRAVVKALEIPVELGGGMRSMVAIDRMLALGVDSVIVGTMAVREPQTLEESIYRFGGDRVQLGIDARDGKVAVQGWLNVSELDAVQFGREWSARGIQRVIFTDIARDGMLRGPNVDAVREFALGTRSARNGSIPTAIVAASTGMIPDAGATGPLNQHPDGLMITASGGVSQAADLEQLATLEDLGVDRVIIGKALYEGTVDLAQVV